MLKEGQSRLTVEVPIELHRRAKIRAVELGTDLRSLVIEALERALAERKPKKGGRDGR
jgi:predicted HicB family RNase H-like nuclease